jgi:hypothetical protein
MTTYELRDLDLAKQFVTQGLWLQRVTAPTSSTVRPAIEWALEIAAGGNKLPPIGFVADLGHILFGLDGDSRPHRDAPQLPGLPVGLARAYEDLVLGKVITDWTIERSGHALRSYHGRDRARGLAFVVNQFRDRAGFEGVLLSPAVLKSLFEASPDDVLARGWDSLTRAGVQPLLVQLYEGLIAATRTVADVLGTTDVFELEHGTALAELGQRVALRQVLQEAERLEAALPKHKPRPPAGHREVLTRVLDEDTYPVGGFASLSTRGSIESLLHSQLAYMEPEPRVGAPAATQPDLFDIKFLRDELLYYSRDENQLRRRRRSFVIALQPDLVLARFKDVGLPTQRIVLTLALLVALVRRLTDWLSSDALVFEFLFLAENETRPLEHEHALLEMLFREPIANGTVKVSRVANLGEAAMVCTERARRGLCHALCVGADPAPLPADVVDMSRLVIAGPRPRLMTRDGELPIEGDDAQDVWQSTLQRLIELWV